ncbi:metallo-dependent phosphatase-like protein [Artemisia annua]|uniref:Metallo-dependent phosphatase-like protein n=1 Tax=Artemisia annua TaxID=35608 RepID=A0A2U1KV82_ARTAN|nr:metallo-dependent phosphatase-like protein [Artemisia annua]
MGAEKSWRDDDHDGNMQDSAESSKTRQLAEAGPYELSQTLPPNATEYIFHALRPR